VCDIIQKRKPRLFEILRKELSPALAEMGLSEMCPDPSSRNYALYYGGNSARGKAIGLWFQRDFKADMVAAFGSASPWSSRPKPARPKHIAVAAFDAESASHLC